jgi:hypothetical protein
LRPQSELHPRLRRPAGGVSPDAFAAVEMHRRATPPLLTFTDDAVDSQDLVV